VLATALYLAALICAWGFISLATNSDVIVERVGPLLGPLIAGTATLIVCAGCLAQLRNQTGWLVPLVTGAAVYLGAPGCAALVVMVTRADAAAGLLFFAARASSPFVPAAAIIACLVVLLVPLVRGTGRSAP